MQVGDWRPAQSADVPVDPSHEPIDVIAQLSVLLHPFSRRRCHLNESNPFRIDQTLREQFTESSNAFGESLGVVEPIDAKEQRLWVAEVVPKFFCPLQGLRL